MDAAPPSADGSSVIDPGPFADRVIDGVVGWMQTMSIHLGIELGWYRALAEGARTAPDLAAVTGTSVRYAREWLEQQCAYDILTVDSPDAHADERRFSLPADRAEVLLDTHSLAFAGPVATMVAASAARMPDIVNAYRTGGGVSWEQLGELARTAQADVNRPWFDTLPAELAKIPELVELLDRPGARLADVGTGAGWSALALAAAYPDLEVVGIDIDAPSIEMARENAAGAGLDARAHFIHDDAANLSAHGAFDVVIALECLHDMPYPVAVLTAMREAVRADGAVLILDEAVNERFSPAAGVLERLMYGYSLFVCLPDGMSHSDSAATGTVMRPSVLANYAQQAGFAEVDVLLDEFGFWRLYRLR
jgi:2-polyprenyl-3-methyl-5-hydroxy-6-metoxy-1,4-benzoquinol methylase